MFHEEMVHSGQLSEEMQSRQHIEENAKIPGPSVNWSKSVILGFEHLTSICSSLLANALIASPLTAVLIIVSSSNITSLIDLALLAASNHAVDVCLIDARSEFR